jgi:hypothetical protein
VRSLPIAAPARRDHGAQIARHRYLDLFQAVPPSALANVEILVGDLHCFLVAGAKQIVLVVDIAVERGLADAEALGHIFQSGPMAAAAIKHPRRLPNDGLALGIRLLGAAWHRIGPTSHSHPPCPLIFGEVFFQNGITGAKVQIG